MAHILRLSLLPPLAAGLCRCAPGNTTFPECFDRSDWQSLRAALQGTLYQEADIKLPQDVDTQAALTDPQFLTHGGPGFSTFSGYAEAWDRGSVLPRAAAEVERVEDVQAVVRFAADNNLRLAVKATGHDFHGRSLASGSLVLWTHKLTDISWRSDDFCGVHHENVVEVGAGVQFWQLYLEAQSRNRFVAGGTCSTVGHVGYTSGGGYGYYAKYYGSGASNVLEAQIVLASGELVTATPCNEYSDLLRAIRGGGGGTYGVVVAISYLTHEMPSQRGWILTNVAGTPDQIGDRLTNVLDVFRGLIEADKFKYFDGFVQVDRAGTIQINMVYLGMSSAECNQLMSKISFAVVACNPASGPMWTAAGKPSSPHGPQGNWYNSWETDESSQMWAQTHARFFKLEHFADAEKSRTLATKLQAFVQSWTGDVQGELQLAFQYGLGHGHPRVLETFNDTSVHQDVKDAVGTIKLVRFQTHTVGDRFSIGNFTEAQKDAHEQIDSMLGVTGAYLNEAAWDQQDWKDRYWGHNVDFLEATKGKYDPTTVFTCYRCLGSDSWDMAGNCRQVPAPLEV